MPAVDPRDVESRIEVWFKFNHGLAGRLVVSYWNWNKGNGKKIQTSKHFESLSRYKL